MLRNPLSINGKMSRHKISLTVTEQLVIQRYQRNGDVLSNMTGWAAFVGVALLTLLAVYGLLSQQAILVFGAFCGVLILIAWYLILDLHCRVIIRSICEKMAVQ